MITVYYVQKGSTFEIIREAYVARELSRFPDRTLRELGYLNSEDINGQEIKYEKFVSFENAYRALKPDSRMVVDNLRAINMDLSQLKELLFSRKDELLQLRVLEPNILFDPSEKITYTILDLAHDAERAGIRREEEKKPPKKIVMVSRENVTPEDLILEGGGCRLKDVNTKKREPIFRPGTDKKSYMRLREPHPKLLRDEVLKDRIKGLTYQEIREKYHVSNDFIATVVKENHVKIQKPRLSSYNQKYNTYQYKTPPYLLEGSFLDKAFRAFLLNQKKVSTAHAYEGGLKFLLTYLAKNTPKGKLEEVEDLLKFELVMEYKKAFEEKKGTYKSIECLKRFLRHLHAIGIQFKNPIAFIKSKKIIVERTKRISQEDVGKILKTAREILDESRGKSVEIQWAAHRDFLAVYLLASCGMRHSALLHLRKKDFIFKPSGSSKLRLLSKSMSGHFEINISAAIAQKIETFVEIFLNDDPPETYIFCAANRPDQKTVRPINENVSSRNLRHIYERSQITSVNKISRVAHTLRVTFATQMYESGVDIHKIKEILNHAHVNQTYQYIDVSSYENVIEPSWLPDISYNVPLWA
jgi:site-specific recombinase XerD